MNRWSKLISAIMLLIAITIATGCTKTDDPNNGGNNGGNGNTLNGHEYVDLRLPSGTLWATCNVGATSPEGYGDYFAWGETTSKTTYDWSTYQYCDGGDGWNTLTKYCGSTVYGYNGFTDNLTVLQASDDAATANWGIGWSMPTQEQYQELIDNTTNKWTTQNGVNGRLFTARNGKTLFLPVAGYYIDNETDQVGSWGCYWSSSLSTGSPNNAWSIELTRFYGAGLSGMAYRSIGSPIRPVCEH